MRFDVCLSAIATVTINTPAQQQPADYTQFVGKTGDRYRDDFTRSVLYLINKFSGETKTTDAVVLASRYGNLASMSGLSQLAISRSPRISAQIFPNATTSSAATYANIEKKLQGGNITINGGDGNPVMALYYACSDLQLTGHGQHIFVGDCYSDLAVEDLLKRFSAEEINSVDDNLCNHVTYIQITEPEFESGAALAETMASLNFYFNKSYEEVFAELSVVNCWVLVEDPFKKADIIAKFPDVRFFSPVHQSALLNEWALSRHRTKQPVGMMMIRENGWLEGVIIE